MENKLSTGELLLKKRTSALNKVIVIVSFIVICVTMFFTFFAAIITDGESMQNTIMDRQVCFISRLAYKVERNDIVIIKFGNNPKLIKRVIALDGDSLIFMESENRLYVDLYLKAYGENYYVYCDEPFIKERMRKHVSYYNVSIMPYTADLCDIDTSVQSEKADFINNYAFNIDRGDVFFMGDNRNVSRDSRYYGTCKISEVIAEVIVITNPNGFFQSFLTFLFLRGANNG